MATKIKLEIESDESIIAAKVLLKNENGQITIDDIQTTTDDQSKKIEKSKSTVLEGISEDMKATW